MTKILKSPHPIRSAELTTKPSPQWGEGKGEGVIRNWNLELIWNLPAAGREFVIWDFIGNWKPWCLKSSVLIAVRRKR